MTHDHRIEQSGSANVFPQDFYALFCQLLEKKKEQALREIGVNGEPHQEVLRRFEPPSSEAFAALLANMPIACREQFVDGIRAAAKEASPSLMPNDVSVGLSTLVRDRG